TAASFTSYRTTASPRSASASPSGRPTWPHPPTTTTSVGKLRALAALRPPAGLTMGRDVRRPRARSMARRRLPSPSMASLEEGAGSAGLDYRRLYEFRFRGISQRDRQGVWDEIAAQVYEWMGRPDRVLDPAAGRGEFVNAIPARERWVIDAVEHDEAY